MKRTAQSKIGYYWTTDPAAVGYADNADQAAAAMRQGQELASTGADGMTTARGVAGVRDEIRRKIGQGVNYTLFLAWLSDKTPVKRDELEELAI